MQAYIRENQTLYWHFEWTWFPARTSSPRRPNDVRILFRGRQRRQKARSCFAASISNQTHFVYFLLYCKWIHQAEKQLQERKPIHWLPFENTNRNCTEPLQTSVYNEVTIVQRWHRIKQQREFFANILSGWMKQTIKNSCTAFADGWGRVEKPGSIWTASSLFFRKMLTDLGENENFNECMKFLQNREAFLREKMNEYAKSILAAKRKNKSMMTPMIVEREIQTYRQGIHYVIAGGTWKELVHQFWGLFAVDTQQVTTRPCFVRLTIFWSSKAFT